HESGQVLFPKVAVLVGLSEVQPGGLALRSTSANVAAVTFLQRQTDCVVHAIEVNEHTGLSATALDFPGGRDAITVAGMNSDNPPAPAEQRFLQGLQMGLRHNLVLLRRTARLASDSRRQGDEARLILCRVAVRL